MRRITSEPYLENSYLGYEISSSQSGHDRWVRRAERNRNPKGYGLCLVLHRAPATLALRVPAWTAADFKGPGHFVEVVGLFPAHREEEPGGRCGAASLVGNDAQDVANVLQSHHDRLPFPHTPEHLVRHLQQAVVIARTGPCVVAATGPASRKEHPRARRSHRRGCRTSLRAARHRARWSRPGRPAA